uniref:Uncharacterized protein n=1 Tax=Tetranychus urticae TaxID=32264 RepID=T1KHW9_TETUR
MFIIMYALWCVQTVCHCIGL